MRHQRTAPATLERGKRDGDRFRFGMTLATEGEASDGHILSIRGGEIPERFPLLAVHDAYALESTLGSVVEGRKHYAGEIPELRATGEINLEGEGDAADARRDVANMIEAGDLSAVSIRWEPIDAVRRINLPGDHPAFVDPEDPDPRKRYGLFFKKWRAVEGSVVPIGADAAAKIAARADAWRAKGREAVATFVRTFVAPAPADPAAAALETLVEGARLARAAGVELEEIRRGLAELLELDAYVAPAIARELAELRARSHPRRRESRRREEPLTVDDLAALLSKHDRRLERSVEQMLARALGATGDL